MEKFIANTMLKIEDTLPSTFRLDNIKPPVSVNVSNQSLYVPHCGADNVLTGLRNGDSDTVITNRTNQYNTLATRTYSHMLKALRTPIRLDELLADGYKYLVVRVPNYIRRFPYNEFKKDYRNIEWRMNNTYIWTCGIDESGKPDFVRTNPIVSKYITKLSLNSLKPFNLVATTNISADDVGASQQDGSKYTIEYMFECIDLDYFVNTLDCVFLSLAVVGYQGDFHWNSSVSESERILHYDSNMIQNLQYYYM